ncbi:hypothetical protein C3Y87_17425 [Carbonactinospora thermoautotrophica]|uniref:class I SAM-dependent methyltransferase n=1 Tax=Carbonactinospora thermoautotrophica TaxID=1469144 RepID=UPI00227087BA|nr:class I SAM-dependent methyltransferase [Carbonactinospora thermoautotrophica]MCX9193156.1 hypothetical protein [Carbonactinospora thermoautotrophica]
MPASPGAAEMEPTTRSVPVTRLVWIDDLVHLDVDYLRHRFRPFDQGLDPATVALALQGAQEVTRRHVLDHVALPVAEQLRRQRLEPGSCADVFAAQLAVVSVYFWEIVYHKYPDVYEWFSTAQDVPFDELFPVDVVRGRRVVDLGTGTGRVITHLAPHAARVWGVDPSRPMLDVARQKFAGQPHVELLEGAFDGVPLPSGSTDVVVSCFAYQVSEERGGHRGLAEIRRLLRPGGVALLAVMNDRTGEFLRAQGLTERVPSRPVVWTRPRTPAPPLLDYLFDVARVDFGGEDTTTTPITVYEMRV